MSSYFDEASLVMIPSGYKTSKLYSIKPTDGSGDMSFSRSNDTATRVNSAGLIEKVRTNLVLQSQAFNTTWTPDNGGGSGTATITANSHSAPDGTMTADRVQLARGSVYMNIYQNVSSTAGLKYTASVYLKSLSGTPNISILYDSVPYSVTLTTDWVRYSVTYTASGSSTAPLLGLFGGNSATADIVAWGYQLEVSDFGATPYIATTSSAVSVGPVANVPRLDYLGSSCPRLLLEPQRTNLRTSSEQFSSLSPSNVTVTSNDTTSPDGYTNADKLTPSGSGFHTIGNSISVTAGQKYTISVFYKYGTHKNIGFYDNNTAGSEITINMETNAFTLGPSVEAGGVVPYGNGWYRAYATFTAGTADMVNYIIFRDNTNNGNYTGDGSYSWFYGWQVELGAYATSYIPTLGAAVTRGAEGALNFSALVNNTSFTLFFEGSYTQADADYFDLLVGVNQFSGNYFSFYNGFIAIYNAGGGTQTFGTALAPNTVHKLLIKYDGTTAKYYRNGSLFLSISATGLGTFADGYIYNNDQEGLKVNQLLYFPTALSDADCAALTA